MKFLKQAVKLLIADLTIATTIGCFQHSLNLSMGNEMVDVADSDAKFLQTDGARTVNIKEFKAFQQPLVSLLKEIAL